MSNYYYDRDIIVSWRFVDYAFQMAGKLVYKNRSERYKNASSLVTQAIELRNDLLDKFIEEYTDLYADGGCIKRDAYDTIDEWYWWEEKSYDEIWHQVWLDEYQESEDEDVCKEFRWTQTQIEEVEEWCRNNWYWYDGSYEVAVQDVYTYNQ